MSKIHVTLQDDQALSPEEQQALFGEAGGFETSTENGKTVLTGNEQAIVSDAQIAALSTLPLPERVVGRGIEFDLTKT